MSKQKWITPFIKQCFVTLGVSLNMMQHGLSVGYAAVLLPQLRAPGSTIPIDDNSGSWIASIIGFALIPGNFVVPSVMSKFGRRIANLVSVVPMVIAWLTISLSESFGVLLFARCLQGFSMGIGSSLGPVLIGEYSSPKNRGAFLTTVSLAMAAGVLISQTLGSYLSWQLTALICAIISFTDLVIVLFSPESPSWLIESQKYEEGKRVFRWLRGDEEEAELRKMIEVDIQLKDSQIDIDIEETCRQKFRRNYNYVKTTILKPEFYKPIFVMMHIYTLAQWSGASVLASYTADIFHQVLGPNINTPLLLITLTGQRIISNTSAVFAIKKFRRRRILLVTVSLNIFAYFATAAYTYAKANNWLPFDHPAIGLLLIHIHMFSIATGTVPLPFIIAGEVFPLEFRSLAGGISVLFLSINFFITVKLVSYLFRTIGIYGTYAIYGTVVAYCLVISMLCLPETKDKTLQEIEDEFRGRPLSPEEIKSVQSLTSLKYYVTDRRCSSPAVI